MREIELPDGTIAEFPENMSNEQIQSALSKLFPRPEQTPAPVAKKSMLEKLGDASTGFVDNLTNPDYYEGLLRSDLQGRSFGFGDEAVAKVGSFIADPILDIMSRDISDQVQYDRGDIEQQILEDERGRLSQFREDSPVSSIGAELFGGIQQGGNLLKGAKAVAPQNVSKLAQLAKAKPVAATAGTGAVSGGIYGAGASEGDAVERLKKGGEAAIVSGVIGGATGKLLSKVAPKINVIDDLKEGVDEIYEGAAKQVDDVLAQSKNLTKEQVENLQALKAAGINKPTAAMVSRDPKLWQFEQNTRGITGVGDEINERYIQSNLRIQEALQDLSNKTGGQKKTNYQVGKSLMNAVNKKRDEMQDEIGKLYKEVAKNVDNYDGSVTENLVQKIDDFEFDSLAADWNGGNAILGKLRKLGVIDKDGNSLRKLNIKEAEDIRKFMNGLSDKRDDSIIRIKSEFIKALDEDVIDGAGVDAYSKARKAAQDRFEEYSTKTLKKISKDNIVAEDAVKKIFFSGDVDDLNSFKESLLSGTDAQVKRGSEAWVDLKKRVIDDIFDKALSVGTEGGERKLSGSGLIRVLDKIEPEKLSTLLDPQEVDQIRKIARAAELTTITVPDSFVNFSGTNTAFANMLKNSGAAKLLDSVASGVESIPVVGTLTSPATGALKVGAKSLKEKATKESVKRVLNPSVKAGLPPKVSGTVGISAGIVPNRQE